MAAELPALAIDVGGTKFAAGLVEPGGRVISWSQTATPHELDGEQLWRTLDALVTRILADAHADPVAGQIASLCSRTGSPGNRCRSRSRSGKSRQAGMFSGETRPAGHAIGPPHPQPTPASPATGSTCASARMRVTRASRVRQSCSPSSSWGVAVCDHEMIRPPGSTSPAASLVPPTSIASAGSPAAMSVLLCRYLPERTPPAWPA